MIEILIYSTIFFLILICIIVIIKSFTNKKNKSEKYIEILKDIIKEDNIECLSTEMSRFVIQVKNIEEIDLDKLKELSNDGILVTGNKIKIVFKDNIESLMRKMK